MTDPIIAAARFIERNLEWARHRPEVDELLSDLDRCARVVRGLARGPNEQKYLGPCGARRDHDSQCGCEGAPGCDVPETCEGDVYGPRGGSRGSCRLCGAEVAQRDREAWLDGEVRSHAFRASEIAGAYGVKANTIRVWHARGQLANHGTDSDGRPLFNVGDVLDLAAADALRRHEAQVKRARRREQAETDERMSA